MDTDTMAQFYVGAYSDATQQVQDAWIFLILDFLGRVFHVKTKQFAHESFSEIRACTPQMQALALWAVEVYADSRWIPEYESDQRRKEAGQAKEKRKGKTVSLDKIDQYDLLVDKIESHQQTAHFQTWEKAIQDEAKSRLELPDMGRSLKSNSSSGRAVKKRRVVKCVFLG